MIDFRIFSKGRRQREGPALLFFRQGIGPETIRALRPFLGAILGQFQSCLSEANIINVVLSWQSFEFEQGFV